MSRHPDYDEAIAQSDSVAFLDRLARAAGYRDGKAALRHYCELQGQPLVRDRWQASVPGGVDNYLDWLKGLARKERRR